jgi:phosphoribosylanthranilate isomerase
MNYKVKICGMTDLENVRLISELSPDLLGFVMVPTSKRFVSAETVATIGTPAHIARIGVIADANIEEIENIIATARLDGVQLHGNESADFCAALRKLLPRTLLIKALSGRSESLETDIRDFEDVCDMLLFDSTAGGQGGSGEMFDHSNLTNAGITKPFLLSGGLDASSVNQSIDALRNTTLAGFDFNSRIETAPGIKSVEKAAEAIKEVRNALSNN